MVTFNRAGNSAGGGLEHGTTGLVRHRRKLVHDPRKDEMVPGSWNNPDVLPLPGAYVESGASGVDGEALRGLVESTDRISVPAIDGSFPDVAVGDRIVGDGRRWTVTGFPGADKNPFSGWQPVRHVRVKEAKG